MYEKALNELLNSPDFEEHAIEILNNIALVIESETELYETLNEENPYLADLISDVVYQTQEHMDKHAEDF